MRIFISYSTPDHAVAEEIQLALLGEGHDVFFDKDSLPAGGNYHARINNAIALADAIIFLVTPSSVAPGSYALTELKFARNRWPHPKGRVLPVRLLSTPWDKIPAYLKSVTVLEPSGNIAAEVLAAVASLPTDQAPSFEAKRSPPTLTNSDSVAVTTTKNSRVQIWIAVISLVGVLGSAMIYNWDKLFTTKQLGPAVEAAQQTLGEINPPTGGIPGSDTATPGSPTFNPNCSESTFWDYSKAPPESKIIRRCPP